MIGLQNLVREFITELMMNSLVGSTGFFSGIALLRIRFRKVTSVSRLRGMLFLFHDVLSFDFWNRDV